MTNPTTHGWEYRKAQQRFLREQADNKNLSRSIRQWLREQRKRVDSGKQRAIKVPPGKDVGHKKAAISGGPHESKNFRLEDASSNRARGPRERRIAKKGLKDTLKNLKKTRKRRYKRIERKSRKSGIKQPVRKSRKPTDDDIPKKIKDWLRRKGRLR